MAKEYDIAKPADTCRACGKELAPGEEFVAALCEAGEELERQDYCAACWDPDASEGEDRRFGVWRTRVPTPQEKKRLFIDDASLISFFERLEGAEEPAKIHFRYVLTLILMRKKLLVYEGSQQGGDGRDLWTMRLRGDDSTFQVVDPHMDEQQIAQVSRQLGQILEEDL